MEEYSELHDLLEIDSPVGSTAKASAYKGKSEPQATKAAILSTTLEVSPA